MDNFRIFKGFRTFLYNSRLQESEHSSSLEDPEDNDDRDHHQYKDKSPHPRRAAQEITEADVHTEEAGYQGRRHEHEGHEGEHLHDLVLIEVDDTEDCVLEVLQTLEAEVGMVDKRRDIFEEDIQP